MTKGTKKPPSRIRYEEKHPTVSCRITQDIYSMIKEAKAREGRSLLDIIKKGLGISDSQESYIYKVPEDIEMDLRVEGFTDGFRDAEETYKVTFHCHVCGGLIELTDDDAKIAAGDYMEQHNWSHTECTGKARRGYPYRSW
ncbi:hypothetical protein ACFLWY_05450 [Chloroflexota bacterium]